MLPALLLAIVLRTTFASRSPRYADVSEIVSAMETGILATRTVVSTQEQFLYGDTKLRPAAHMRTVRKTESRALAAWRQLAALPGAHAAGQRRLAISMALFGTPGTDAAFRGIAASRDRDLVDRLPGHDQLDVLEPVHVSAAEESALWTSIYGGQAITRARAAAIRADLTRLHLGWFEDVAAVRLYRQAGMSAQADAEATRLTASTAMVYSFIALEVLVIVAGTLGLLIGGIVLLARTNRPRGVTPRAYHRVAPSSFPPTYSEEALSGGVRVARATWSVPAFAAPEDSRFAPSARIGAFIAYLAAFSLSGFPLRALARMLKGHIYLSAFRIDTILEILAYVPVVAIVLWTLRRLAARQSVSGDTPSWRELLRALGVVPNAPAANVLSGAGAYVLTAPVFMVASVASALLFAHSHTPINPAQAESIMAQASVDRVLLLVVAAVAAPIVEEMMFRGLLYPALRARNGVVGGAALSAAVFALVHPTLPGGFLQIWILGCAFALTVERRRSLLSSIVMHAIHNGLIIAMSFALFGR